jgi:hypothetical protein
MLVLFNDEVVELDAADGGLGAAQAALPGVPLARLDELAAVELAQALAFRRPYLTPPLTRALAALLADRLGANALSVRAGNARAPYEVEVRHASLERGDLLRLTRAAGLERQALAREVWRKAA